MLQQQTVDKDVAPANFAEEDQVRRVIEETDVAPGHAAPAIKNEAQNKMPDKGPAPE